MRKIYFWVFTLTLLIYPNFVKAVTWDIADIKFGINAFLDLEYTYMEEMPMGNKENKTDIMSMSGRNWFDQNHMNMLFEAEKKKLKLHINLESRHSYDSGDTDDDGGIGSFKIQQAYGEYKFLNQLKVKTGQILAPFGLYNDIRYISSLFSTIVLPIIYELPINYDGDHLYPDNINIQISGTFFMNAFDLEYHIYTGNGHRENDGRDNNNDKLIGGRIMTSIFEDFNIGTSFFTDLSKEDIGRHSVVSLDLDLTIRENINFQSEYLFDFHDESKSKDRTSYYTRLSYELDKITPFIAFDYFRDYGHFIYKRGISRFGIGTSYQFNDNTTGKIEYHYHKFGTSVGLPDGTDSFNMVKSALIYTF